MTRGIPAASTWATRLLVVPRSMPTMRDMRAGVPSRGLAQVLDGGAQVSPRGQALLESIDERPTVRSAVHRGIPLGRPLDDRGLLRASARLEAIPLPAQTLGRFSGQPRRLGLLERSEERRVGKSVDLYGGCTSKKREVLEILAPPNTHTT